MKIKVTFLDNDSNYLKRITAAITSKFSDRIEVYAFTDAEAAVEGLVKDRINVFISSDAFEIDPSRVPGRCAFAYFVGSENIKSLRNQKTISRFQKVEIIYKEILSLYSENIPDIGFENGEEATVISFMSVSGGVGVSSMSAAFAKKMALKGKKVLYLSIERFDDSEMFFAGDGHFTFSDVIYALKSKKANLPLKLESIAKEDSSGVHYFAGAKNSLDMSAFNDEDLSNLVTAMKESGQYNIIVIDSGFDIDNRTELVFKLSSSVVFVSDGSEIANSKFQRAVNSLREYERQHDLTMLVKASIIYNKFSNKTGKIIDDNEIRTIGGINRFEHATTSQVIDALMRNNTLDRIIEVGVEK